MSISVWALSHSVRIGDAAFLLLGIQPVERSDKERCNRWPEVEALYRVLAEAANSGHITISGNYEHLPFGQLFLDLDAPLPRLPLLDRSSLVQWASVHGLNISMLDTDQIPDSPSQQPYGWRPAFKHKTKALDAIYQAIENHWLDYDPARPPLQKSVAATIAGILDVAPNARQAEELARAIKPDDPE